MKFDFGKFSRFVVIAGGCFVWGLAAAHFHIFPWKLIKPIGSDVAAFVEGGVDDSTSIFEKGLNDLGVLPARQIREFVPPPSEQLVELPVMGLRERREQPRIFLSPDAPKGYRLLVGGFDFEDDFWGAILLNPSGKVVRQWHMSTKAAGLSDERGELRNLYGVAFLRGGSAIFNMQEPGKGLVRVDACSGVIWGRPGIFHHTVSLNEDETGFWTFGGRQGQMHPRILLLDVTDGKTLKDIDMAEVERENPDVFIFDLQRNLHVENSTHPNDIEPLPSSLAHAFPGFKVGDLLISYNTTNLIFVLDPETLKVKWWRMGVADRQHDADWQPDGTISIFNNNRRSHVRDKSQMSTIVSINPVTYEHRVLVDGRNYDFYAGYNGHHQITPAGTILITSSPQGRVFEVNPATGEKVFEFVNTYNWDKGQTLHMAESFFLDEAAVKSWALPDCDAR